MTRGKIRLYKNGTLLRERMYWSKSQRDDLISSWRAMRTDADVWEIGIEPYIKSEAVPRPKQVSTKAKKVNEVDTDGNILAVVQ